MIPEDYSYSMLKDIESRLSQFRSHPMMIIWGEKDFCFNERFLGRWKTYFPKAEVEKVSDAGHYVVEDAEAFVRRFILPGLDKVLEGVEPENPYTCVIEVLRRLLESEFGKADTSLNRDKARLVELPLLNSVLHYNNTEDLEGLKKKR